MQKDEGLSINSSRKRAVETLSDCLPVTPWAVRAEREQPSQIFTFLFSPKLVRHVRCYPNSGQIVAVPRLSAMCQKRTHAPQQSVSLFDHRVGAGEHCRRNCEA